MNETIEKAIEWMALAVRTLRTECHDESRSPDVALKYSQAALNLAHVRSILLAEERAKSEKTGASA